MQFFVDLIVGNKPGNTSKVFSEFRKFRLTPSIVGKKAIADGKLLAMRLKVNFDDDMDLLEAHFSRVPFLKLIKVSEAAGRLNANKDNEELTAVEEKGREEIMSLDIEEDDDDLDIDIFENYKGRRDKF